MGGSNHPVRILDLSETGAFVETVVELDYEEAGKLELALPGGEPWAASVSVVRLGTSHREVRHPRVENVTVARPGVGLQFVGMNEEDLERLRGFLELLDER
ncbi:MAG: PilZ domain-containing protein [Myxococcales bacterium]|nr:PilZ domain-containing protein [Myxococcales bacterium]